ncbi:MAG: ExbD/TolR family protein [Chitinophagaceae bacterium]
MSQFKVKKKSTWVDMTAFCDVGFLLLTFFILATKFKAPEPVEIKAPGSVASASVPDDNVITILFDKEGRVFIGSDKEEIKGVMLNNVNQKYNLGLTSEEIAYCIKNVNSIGVPVSQLKTLANGGISEKDQIGIPCDSTANELTDWLAGLFAYQGKAAQFMVKGDENAPYIVFDNIKKAFMANRLLMINLITSQEQVPVGTPLYNKQNGIEK